MLTDDEIREICDRYELIYNITDNVVLFAQHVDVGTYFCEEMRLSIYATRIIDGRRGQHRKHTRNLLKIITTRNWKRRTFVKWSVIL